MLTLPLSLECQPLYPLSQSHDLVVRTIIPGTKNYGPEQSLVYSHGEGNKLGKALSSQGWSHIHLIAHSAGAGLIQAATDVIKPSATTVHCTFLDPFVGLKFEEKTKYGANSDWSDQYYSHDLETGGSLYAVTETLLNHAYNVNVTQLNRVRNYGAFVSAGNGVTEPCYQSATSHGWAIDFYSKSITGTGTSEYDGFGFPLSEEGGNWSHALSSLTPGNNPAHVLGTPDDNCVSLASVDPQTMLNVAVSLTPSVQIGDVAQYDNGFTATTHSPAWIDMVIVPTNVMNFVSLDAEFLSATNAQGLLSVYWDDSTIGSIDEQAVQPGLQHYTFAFPAAAMNSTHMLGFRIDPFTNVQSIVLVTNIVLGTIGPSQPFYLTVTTNIISGSPVYELAGPAGFNYNIEASTNLINWDMIATLVNTNGAVQFLRSERYKL